MALTYDSYVSQMATLVVVSSADTNFLTILPACIDYAEQRLYRELDLLYTQVTSASTSLILSSGNRNFTNGSSFITIDNFNVLSPVGTQSSVATRVPLMPVSREWIDTVYPSGQTVTSTPEYFARISDTQIILGPPPDAAYYVEVSGIQRPSALSSGNSSTVLTQYIPDCMVAASMVFMTGYQRDFGAQSDNPQAAQSWEGQLQLLMKSAGFEQARAKFEAEGWTSQSPSPLASPKRV